MFKYLKSFFSNIFLSLIIDPTMFSIQEAIPSSWNENHLPKARLLKDESLAGTWAFFGT